MKLTVWYIVAVAIWLLVIPIFGLALGFGGWSYAFPDLGDKSVGSLILWAVGWAVFLVPLWLAPFGISRKLD